MICTACNKPMSGANARMVNPYHKECWEEKARGMYPKIYKKITSKQDQEDDTYCQWMQK